MSVLVVWFKNKAVGILSWESGKLTFQYNKSWIDDPNAFALSCSLPLQQEKFDQTHTRPFFAGLLPEERLRQIIAKRIHVSEKNDFMLLAHLGGECAGALTFLLPGEEPKNITSTIQWLDDSELNDVLEKLPFIPMLVDQDNLRLSLAGAQDKLPVVYDGERIGLPQGNQASTHILKPLIPSIEDSVSNEGFCLALAHTLGLQVAKAEMQTIQGKRFLLVERYDRQKLADGKISRIHQEDFCQALGVVPEMKYQNEGGPNLENCFDLLRRVTQPNAPQILQLLDYVIFNALIGNHDAHAKNFSLLYKDTFPIVAPLYDTVSTAIYPSLTRKMAMKIGNKYEFDALFSRHWDQFSESAKLGSAQVRKRVLELAINLQSSAQQLQMQPEYQNNSVIEKIVLLIMQRTSLMIQRFQ